jgi:hypothetical protein
MVDMRQASAEGAWIHPRKEPKVHVIDRMARVLLRIAVDEIDEGVADAFDRRYGELHRAGVGLDAPCAQADGALIRSRRVLDAKGYRADGGAVNAGERLTEAAGFAVDDEVDVALSEQGHIFLAVLCHGLEAHGFEQGAKRLWGRRAAYSTNSKPSVPMGYPTGRVMAPSGV